MEVVAGLGKLRAKGLQTLGMTTNGITLSKQVCVSVCVSVCMSITTNRITLSKLVCMYPTVYIHIGGKSHV